MFIYFNRSNRGHGTSPHSLITHQSSSIWTMSSSEHCRQAIFQFYNVQNLKITTFHICNVLYQAGSRWDPKCVFNFLRFFERTFYNSHYIIFILSWCGTHTKIRSKLVDIVDIATFVVAEGSGWRRVLGDSKPEPSAKGAHPYRKRARLEALRVATTKLTQRWTGYPSWGHPTQLRISRELRITSILDKIDEYRKKWYYNII